MLKIPIYTEIDAQSLLKGVEGMELTELEDFARDLNAIIARKKVQDKDYQVAQLLRLHNETILSPTKKKRYFSLLSKLQSETITTKERKEYLALTAEEEQLRNQRVKYLIQLSQLKNISFNSLMKELGLKPVGHA